MGVSKRGNLGGLKEGKGYHEGLTSQAPLTSPCPPLITTFAC